MTARVDTYDPAYARAFAELNYQWIKEYFVVEDEDRAALEDPEGYAINPGGEIFVVLEDDVVVGCVAMVPAKGDEEGVVYELAKMAVRPDRRGRGHSQLLMQACIDFARGKDADEIMLVTNDVLAPALGLYTSAGFQAVTFSDTRYERGNLEMRLPLKPRD